MYKSDLELPYKSKYKIRDAKTISGFTGQRSQEGKGSP